MGNANFRRRRMSSIQVVEVVQVGYVQFAITVVGVDDS